jgi:hypothetical protein
MVVVRMMMIGSIILWWVMGDDDNCHRSVDIQKMIIIIYFIIIKVKCFSRCRGWRVCKTRTWRSELGVKPEFDFPILPSEPERQRRVIINSLCAAE